MTRPSRQWEHALTMSTLLCGRLRARLLVLRGASVGEKTVIGKGCAFDRPWCIEIGNRAMLEADVYLKIFVDTASVKLGECTFVGRGVEIDVTRGVTIGPHSLIAPRCFITDHNHGIHPELRIDQQPCSGEPVVIGADVWLGAGVVVLPGVRIGDGAVVGANSVVTDDVEAMTVVAGTPARFLRKRS